MTELAIIQVELVTIMVIQLVIVWVRMNLTNVDSDCSFSSIWVGKQQGYYVLISCLCCI